MIFFKNIQKLPVFLFVLVLLSMRVITEEPNASESGMSAGQGDAKSELPIEPRDAESESPATSDSINVERLNEIVERLNEKVERLNEKVERLPEDYLQKNDLTRAFIVLALLIILSGVLNGILLVKITKAKAVKKQDAQTEAPKVEESRAVLREELSYRSSGEKSGARAAAPAAAESEILSYSQFAAQPKEPPQPETPKAEESRVAASAPSASASGTSSHSQPSAQPKEPQRPVDEPHPLYHSQEAREKRRAGAGDAYLDVNRDVYERFSQGDPVKLFFEKGNYLSSPLALVEGNRLFVNFHRFNESREMPDDMRRMMTQIYTISGALPGFVKSCSPAKVVSKDDKYEVVAKGVLYMES
jgi:hypothetical protein